MLLSLRIGQQRIRSVLDVLLSPLRIANVLPLTGPFPHESGTYPERIGRTAPVWGKTRIEARAVVLGTRDTVVGTRKSWGDGRKGGRCTQVSEGGLWHLSH